MQIHSVSSVPGLFIPMTSPKFSGTIPHCLSFDYDVTSDISDPIPSLKVHLRVSDYMLTGHSIWTLQTIGQGKAKVTVPQLNTPDYVVLDFIGVIGDPMKSSIRLTNVVFADNSCDVNDEAHYELTAGTFKIVTLRSIYSALTSSIYGQDIGKSIQRISITLYKTLNQNTCIRIPDFSIPRYSQHLCEKHCVGKCILTFHLMYVYSSSRVSMPVWGRWGTEMRKCGWTNHFPWFSFPSGSAFHIWWYLTILHNWPKSNDI